MDYTIQHKKKHLLLSFIYFEHKYFPYYDSCILFILITMIPFRNILVYSAAFCELLKKFYISTYFRPWYIFLYNILKEYILLTFLYKTNVWNIRFGPISSHEIYCCIIYWSENICKEKRRLMKRSCIPYSFITVKI